MKVAIAGASGMIGKELVRILSSVSGEGPAYDVCLITRPKSEGRKKATTDIIWDPYKKEIELEKLEELDACICLSGENIASGRWTADKKKKLIDSRVETNSFLISSLAKLSKKPSTYISASAIGIYEPNPSLFYGEDGPIGSQFISEICTAWEQSSKQANSLGMRNVQARLGIVLNPKDGALKKMLLPFSLGLGGPIGSGQQYMSWISLRDTCRAIKYILERDTLFGPINLCSPTPVTNEEFSKTLAQTLHRPCLLRVPSLAISLLLGEMGEQLLLSSLGIIPQKLLESEFKFEDTSLSETLAGLLGKQT